jgi:glyoxylase I family protein
MNWTQSDSSSTRSGVPELQGFSHIDLTVSECQAAAAWWQDVMGFIVLNRSRRETFEAWTLIHSSGLVVSVVAHDAPLNGAFDERRVGLDHLGFKVADRDELDRWVAHFDAKGVSHSGVIDIGFGPTVVFRDPDNIQLELFVLPSADELTGVLSDADSAEAQQALRRL